MHSYKLAMKSVITQVGEKTESLKVKHQSGNCYQSEWRGKSLGQGSILETVGQEWPGRGGWKAVTERTFTRCGGIGREEVEWQGDGFSLPIWLDGGAVNWGKVYKRRSM